MKRRDDGRAQAEGLGQDAHLGHAARCHRQEGGHHGHIGALGYQPCRHHAHRQNAQGDNSHRGQGARCAGKKRAIDVLSQTPTNDNLRRNQSQVGQAASDVVVGANGCNEQGAQDPWVGHFQFLKAPTCESGCDQEAHRHGPTEHPNAWRGHDRRGPTGPCNVGRG